MKLVSVTLSGNSESIIADALKSVVDFVDHCILVDTGIKDRTIEIAREIAGDKLIVRQFKWCNDFSAARNYTLQVAQESNADWALILDTDERIHLNGEDLNVKLQEPNIGCYLVNYVDNSYSKARFIKVPSKAKFFGPTHEVYPAYEVGSANLEKCRFSELGKTVAQAKKKFERDVEILLKHTSRNPKDPRWLYYLGDSYKNLQKYKEAIRAYQKCWGLNGWDEESAWAMYKAAECFVELKDWKSAIESCSKGLLRHPTVAELPWLASYCCYQIGDLKKAISWATISASLGYPFGLQSEANRIGFRYQLALWEGPFDVLRACYKQLLQSDPNNTYLLNKLEESESKFQEALRLKNKHV